MKAAALIILKDNKVLLCKRSNSLSEEPGKWENVGGSIDGDESFDSAIIREVKEELGVDAKYLEVALQYHNSLGETEIVVFKGEIEGKPKIMEPEACDEIRYFEISELKNVDLAQFTRKDFIKLGWIKD